MRTQSSEIIYCSAVEIVKFAVVDVAIECFHGRLKCDSRILVKAIKCNVNRITHNIIAEYEILVLSVTRPSIIFN